MKGSACFSNFLVERALELGFDSVGVTPVGAVTRGDEFLRWLDEGMHGDMTYMARNTEARLDPSVLHPGARSAVVVAMSHNLVAIEGSGGLARYARGRDYHKVLRKRLRDLGLFVDRELGQGSCLPRPFVDSAPVLERDLADRVGIGWIGKSTNLINQSLGSYLFLGEFLVGHELASVGTACPPRCGRCTKCIEHCPTGAIVKPYRVDARRCISYLTIEHRGAIPWALRPLIGDRLFGCDICQVVCPWNRKAPPLREEAFRPRPEIVGLSASSFLLMSRPDFESLIVGSPIRRTGRDCMARNAAVVLGNSGDPDVVPDLVTALEQDASGLVRAHAAWALGQLGTVAARAGLERARRSEVDGVVREEIEAALVRAG